MSAAILQGDNECYRGVRKLIMPGLKYPPISSRQKTSSTRRDQGRQPTFDEPGAADERSFVDKLALTNLHESDVAAYRTWSDSSLVPYTSRSHLPRAVSDGPKLIPRQEDPIKNLRSNMPLILCMVIGGVVVTATLAVGLAWILRRPCCSIGRRKDKLDRSTWSPSAHTSTNPTSDEKLQSRSSLDSVTVKDEDDDAKLKASDGYMSGLPILNYQSGAPATNELSTELKNSQLPTWNGRGWSLYDPPVAELQPPPPAALNHAHHLEYRNAAGGGGDYAAANGAFADRDLEGFTWPSAPERQPSFIERLVRPQLASEPDAAAQISASLIVPQPASRMASLGGAANRAMMSMLPVTLRNAATTASRQRATRRRYNEIQAYLDSDFEGTIGAKDRELPVARRIGRHSKRFAVDCTTEEEGTPRPGDQQPGLHPRISSKLPSYHDTLQVNMLRVEQNISNAESTPGLAGVGAAWSRNGLQRALFNGKAEQAVTSTMPMAAGLPKVIEPTQVSKLAFPPLEGDRKTRLMGSVGRWLINVDEASEVADPYTPLSPRPGRKLTRNGSLKSSYSSSTLAETYTASDSLTQVEAEADGSPAGVETIEFRAEHHKHQRRLLRKAQRVAAQTEQLGNDLSRAPSIRPQFFAITDLKQWLDPSKLSTTHGLKVLEEGTDVCSDNDLFRSDVEKTPKPLRKMESFADSEMSFAPAQPLQHGKKDKRQKKVSKKTSSQRLQNGVGSGSVRTNDAKHSRVPVAPIAMSNNVSQITQQSSACQSSAATVVSSLFDEQFDRGTGHANLETREKRSRSSTQTIGTESLSPRSRSLAKARAKAEADAVIKEARRRRKMLSISSRKGRTTKTSRSQENPDLVRKESVMSQPSVYSELTAFSDYQFQSPLLSDGTAVLFTNASCESDTYVAGKDVDEVEELARSRRKTMKKEAKREAKQRRKEAIVRDGPMAAARTTIDVPQRKWKRVTHVDPKQPQHGETMPFPGRSASAVISATNRVNAQTRGSVPAPRRSAHDRAVSVGLVRPSARKNADANWTQEADEDSYPSSPWTSSDSDISLRRWGQEQDRNRRQQRSVSQPHFDHLDKYPHLQDSRDRC